MNHAREQIGSNSYQTIYLLVSIRRPVTVFANRFSSDQWQSFPLLRPIPGFLLALMLTLRHHR